MLSRIHTVCAQIETIEGTFQSATIAAGKALLAYEPTGGPARPTIERQLSGQTLSKGRNITGQGTSTHGFRLDFAAGGNTATVPDEPPWGDLFQGCGMQMQRIKKIPCSGGVDGTIVHRATIREGTDALTITYDGAGTDMVLAMSAAKVLSGASVSTPGDNFSFDTTDDLYNTLTELQVVIDALANWSCALVGDPGHDSSQIFVGSNAIAAAGSHTIGYYNGTGATGEAVGAYVTGASQLAILYLPDDVAFVNTDEIYSNMLAVGTATDDPVDNGYRYTPVSVSKVSFTHTGFDGAGTVVGEILKGTKGGSADCYVKVLAGSSYGVGAGTVYCEVIIGSVQHTMLMTGQTNGKFATTTAGTGAGVPDQGWALSMASVRDGVAVKTRGTRGNYTIALVAGEPAFVSFEFQGLLEGIIDQAALTGISLTPPTALRFQTAEFTFGGIAMRVQNLSLAINNDLQVRPDASASEGGAMVHVADRNPTGSVDPEAVPPGTYDFWAKWTAPTTMEIKTRMGLAEADVCKAAHLAACGNAVWIDVPAAQITACPFGDRGGIQTVVTEFNLTRTTDDGDDELKVYVI